MPVLKVQLSQDIRRIALEQIPSLPAFQALIRNLFDTLPPSDFDITYQDEDGDIIRVRTESDWAEAWRTTHTTAANSNAPRKFMVLPLASSPPAIPSPSFFFPSFPLPPPPTLNVSPEAVDFVNEFEDLGEDKKESPAPFEEQFHRTLEELAEQQASASQSDDEEDGPSSPRVVLNHMEEKIKNAMEAFTVFMRNLGANAKELARDWEPTFAKVDEMFQPIGQLSEQASSDFRVKVEKFQDEVVAFKERVRVALASLDKSSEKKSEEEKEPQESEQVDQNKSQEETNGASTSDSTTSSHHSPFPICLAQPEAPVQRPIPQPEPQQVQLGGSAIKSALADLKALEDMGFTDRRRNLELLSLHHGDLTKVVESLLTC